MQRFGQVQRTNRKEDMQATHDGDEVLLVFRWSWRAARAHRLDPCRQDREVSFVPYGWDDGPERAEIEALSASRRAK